WILVSNEIAQGVFGLIISFCCSRGNRPGWISACVTFQALTCFLLMLPQLVHNSQQDSSTVPNRIQEAVCHVDSTRSPQPEPDTCYFTLTLMFLIQFGAGFGGIALLSHGIAYIDDNVTKKTSPAFIGQVIALRYLGPQLGMTLAWRCMSVYAGPLEQEPDPDSSQWIGAWWLGWPILSTLMFILAIIVGMFPKQLPSQAVKEMAASIVDLARGVTIQEPVDPKLTNTGFWWSLRRLLTNKIIVLNTLATLFLVTAMENYLAFEDKYLESKYYIPRPQQGTGGFQDPWTSRLIISLLKPSLVALHIMVSGLFISRMRMRAGRITALHTFIALSVAIFMFSRTFTNCPSLQIQGQNKGRFQLLQTCNRQCSCPASTVFSPVCSQEGSLLFYSACHAGCADVQHVDDIKKFAFSSADESYLGNSTINKAKGGPCNNPDCNSSWVLNQCFTVLTAAMVGMRLVGNIIITFRSVQPGDKSLAVGLELTLVGLLAYIPGRLLYQLMADTSCMYNGGSSSEECKLYDAEAFGLKLNLTSGCLMLVCAVLSGAVWYFARDLDLFGSDVSEDGDELELGPITRRRDSKVSSRQATPHPNRRNNTEDEGTVQDEIDRMKRQNADPELRLNLMDLSDHMEDSMEVSTPVRRNEASIF
ncbi:hypothetical protein L9F63_016351, partial [Diploptera punctata]